MKKDTTPGHKPLKQVVHRSGIVLKNWSFLAAAQWVLVSNNNNK